MTRRTFVAGSLAFARPAKPACMPDRIATPYKLGRYVLNGSGVDGAFDKVSVDCPFVFRYNGAFCMTFLGFDGVGYQTGMVSSTDLVHWEQRECVLKRDPESPILKYNAAINWILRENDLHSQGKLKAIDGKYLGVYHAYPNQGYEQGAAVIGLCRSKDLRNWTMDPPCLKPEEGAEWERGGLYKPCLLEYKRTYYLFYNAKNQTRGRWNEQTGVAMSRDLIHWTRNPANPVIPNGPPGSPDERFASDPCVLRDQGEWIVYYFGLDAKGVARDLAATSPDLLRATKCEQVLIDVGLKGAIDSIYAHKPSLIAYRGDLYHFYCAVSRPSGKEVRGISVARSRPWTD